MPVQIFDENTAVKYPLSDFHESSIPNDVLVDLSVSGPLALLIGWEDAQSGGDAPMWIHGYPPLPVPTLAADFPGESSQVFLTNLVKRSGVLFVSFEAYPGNPVCHLSVISPEPFKIYKMEAADGVAAWIAFGPGVSRDFEYRDVAVPVDADCLLPRDEPFAALVVNDVVHPAPRSLSIVFNDAFLVSGTGDVARNDAFFQDVMYDLREDIPSRRDRLYDIGGAQPDADGDVKLVDFQRVVMQSSSSSWVETSELPLAEKPLLDGASGAIIGAVVENIVWQGCEDWYAGFRQKFDVGVGCAGETSPTGGIELPMDYIFTGCCSSSSSSSSSSSATSSSVSSSSSNPLAVCPGICTVKYTFYSYGDCVQCDTELRAYMTSIGTTPDATCIAQHHPGGNAGCGGEIGCADGPPGFMTTCGVCCADDCQTQCDTRLPEDVYSIVGTTGTGFSPISPNAAAAQAYSECEAMAAGCALGKAPCDLGLGHTGCMNLYSYGNAETGYFAEWTLCCVRAV